MKTCHKCGTRMWATQVKTPTGPKDSFKTRYDCANGHSGTLEGQAGTPKTEWAHYGAVWPPSERADLPNKDA